MIYCRRYGDRYQIKAAQSEIQVNGSFCCITDLVFVNVQSATAQTLPKISQNHSRETIASPCDDPCLKSFCDDAKSVFRFLGSLHKCSSKAAG